MVPFIYHSSIPLVGGYKKRVDLEHVNSSKKVQECFLEAIECYNHGLYYASMLMSRRAIEQETLDRDAKGKDLYEKIKSLCLDPELEALLKEVKDSGNLAAHPTLEEGEMSIEDKKEHAEASLRFLDTYLLLNRKKSNKSS